MLARKDVQISIFSFLFLVVLALALGASYRLPGLGLRPVHTDEAVLAMKSAEFWQTGHFEYDPRDYHGPAFHQVSWVLGHLMGWGDPASWNMADLRWVSALCGLMLLLSTLLLVDALGRSGTALAMLFSAVSPMMVFYSRYFIMEMLLVVLVSFCLGCLWRYSQGGSRLWLVLGGVSLGLQHATKETFVLNIAAAAVGWLVAYVFTGGFEPRRQSGLSLGPVRSGSRTSRPWLWVLVPALLTSVLSYSQGLSDWGAVKDSLLTYWHYLERSADGGHEKPWHYYLTLIFWRKDTLVWSEALIGGLGCLGMLYAVIGDHKNSARQAFLIFLSVYTVVLFGLYSVLGYKTPWSILSAQHGLTLLAGVAAGAVWARLAGGRLRWLWLALLVVGVYHLCAQSQRLTGTHKNPQLDYSSDARNPYVYSHPPKNFPRLLNTVSAYVEEHGESTRIQVISRDSGWPLPWYWRHWQKVGYQDQVPATIDAEVIVVDNEFYDAVKAKITPVDYVEKTPFSLRPGVFLTVLLRQTVAEPARIPVEVPKELEPSAGPSTLSVPPAFSPALPSLPGSSAP